MKLPIIRRGRVQANTYLTVLVIAMLMGVVLAAYLTMVNTQNSFSMRSQAWNRSIAITEAGVEEAMTHLQKNGVTNVDLFRDGWISWGGFAYKRALLGDCIYEVQISLTSDPVILSRGYVPMVQNYASRKSFGPFLADAWWSDAKLDNYVYRTVRVTTSADGMFMKAMVAKSWIDMNGNNIRTDSYDSGDPQHSTNGFYLTAWAKDNGDVATVTGLTNYTVISVGNADIYGHISTGPKGTVTTGANGGVGSAAWLNAGNHGIQPGWYRDDLNIQLRDVEPPFSGGYYTPAAGSVGGTNYTVLLGTGKYLSTDKQMFTQDGDILVTGNAIWWCKAGLDFSGKGSLVIAPGASLRLFVGDTTGSGTSLSIAGNGIICPYATNCTLFGLPSLTSLAYKGNASFSGAIYAPNADFTLGGGGSDTYDFCGASVTGTVKMNGHFNFHYDEALGRIAGRRGYIITSWNEI